MKKYKIRINTPNKFVIVKNKPVRTPTEFIISEKELRSLDAKLRAEAITDYTLDEIRPRIFISDAAKSPSSTLSSSSSISSSISSLRQEERVTTVDLKKLPSISPGMERIKQESKLSSSTPKDISQTKKYKIKPKDVKLEKNQVEENIKNIENSPTVEELSEALKSKGNSTLLKVLLGDMEEFEDVNQDSLTEEDE